MRRFSSLLVATFALSSSVRAQEIIGHRDVRALAADSVFGAFDRTDSPGCALGVYGDDEILYARGYGMASLELGVPITPHTVFDVGSVSKQFTAMSILLLQKEGKLSIDDPVRRYVPELPPYADRITLRQLLSHTSGVRDYLTLMGLAGWSYDGTADTVDFLRFITHSAEPNFEPGTRYLYSNSGFVLLATIVYRVSGEPLARFAEERIFRPLGMVHTHYQDDHTTVFPNRAEGYGPGAMRSRPEFRVVMSQFDGNAGPGGVQTTVEDFGRWLHNYDDGVVGGREIIQAMTTPTRLRNDSLARMGATLSYGLGVGVGTYRGLRVIEHGGAWAGYRSHFASFPDQHLAVATLCNLTAAKPDSLAHAVAAIYLAKEMAADSDARWVAALEAAPAGRMSLDDLRDFTGVWRNAAIGEVRRTTLSGDTLVLQAGTRAALVPLSATRFRSANGVEVTFSADSADVPTRLEVHTPFGTTTFTRVAAASPSATELAEYAGQYYSAEIETIYRIAVKNGKLEMTRNGRAMGTLDPAYRDGFTRNGGLVLNFTRDARGRVNGFRVDAGRALGVRFERMKT